MKRTILTMAATLLSVFAALSAITRAEGLEEQTRAREVFEHASATYKTMFRAIGYIQANLEHEHDSRGYYSGQNPMIDLPRDESGRAPITLSMKWTCDLMWDRASGDSVSETVRTSHKVNGKEYVRTPRPALYYCIDGVSTGHYAVVTSSLDDSAGWQPSAQEDVGLTKDYTALATLAGRRVDTTLDHYVRTVLRPDGTIPYRISIQEDGGEVRVEISDPSDSVITGLKDRFVFRQMPVGPVLVGFEQTRADGGVTTVAIEYNQVPVDGGEGTLLPTRWVEQQGWAVDAEGKATSREEIRAGTVAAHTGPLDRGALRDDITLRYGVAAAKTLDEWLRNAPARSEPVTGPGA